LEIAEKRPNYTKNAVFWLSEKVTNKSVAPLSVAMLIIIKEKIKFLAFFHILYYIIGMDKEAKEAQKQATAALIRDARRLCGLTLGQFAAECQVSYQYLSQLENAVYPPSAKFLHHMDEALERLKIPEAIRSLDEAALLDKYRALPYDVRPSVVGDGVAEFTWSPQEADLLRSFRQLSPESRQAIINAVAALRAALPAPPGS